MSNPLADTSEETNTLNLPLLKASIDLCLCSFDALPNMAVDLTLW